MGDAICPECGCSMFVVEAGAIAQGSSEEVAIVVATYVVLLCCGCDGVLVDILPVDGS